MQPHNFKRIVKLDMGVSAFGTHPAQKWVVVLLVSRLTQPKGGTVTNTSPYNIGRQMVTMVAEAKPFSSGSLKGYMSQRVPGYQPQRSKYPNPSSLPKEYQEVFMKRIPERTNPKEYGVLRTRWAFQRIRSGHPGDLASQEPGSNRSCS